MILYVWLPVERHGKIFPSGPVYIADYVHKRSDVEQRIFDLSRVESDRMGALRREIEGLEPDIVAFSWRNIQIFAPKQEDPSLENAFEFYYSRNPIRKLKAAIFGLKALLKQMNITGEILSYINAVARDYNSKVIVGGPAFSIFPGQIINKLGEGVLGVVGEGEDVMLKVAQGRSKEELVGEERIVFRRGKDVFKGEQKTPMDFEDTGSVDYEYISKIFPGFEDYLDGYIGVQTKRGCPYKCVFCGYPYLEGKYMRCRRPSAVIEEVRQLRESFGAKKIWFVDSNFISSKKTIPHATEILRGIVEEGLDIEWGGYVRINYVNGDLARAMMDSGIAHLELSPTSGSPKVIKELRMGFKLEDFLGACETIRDAGYTGQEVIVNYSLNAPGETKETLMESIGTYKRLCAIFGEENVKPYIFFLGIQSHTQLEEFAFKTGILPRGYNPLAINPRYVNKVIYNPPPLDRPLVKSYLRAIAEHGYDSNVGRYVLANLEGELRS
ncbi:MAG: B12-binding domain-containing radical SAM protein [Candidatus Hydrothermarchaeaceae archaeon]